MGEMCNEAIILAGGMGTRLKQVIVDKPKPMADINGKPFLHYLVNYLSKNNISRIIMSIGYRSEVIKKYFGKKFKNIEIEYSVENFPLGTGGGILLAMQKVKSNSVFILNGDTFFNINLKQLADFHKKKDAALTIALRKVQDGSRYGSIIINDNNKIEAFREKDEKSKNILINGGTYIINKQILFETDLPGKFSFEKDFLEKYYRKANFVGLEFKNYFIDIGLPSTYKKAQADFLNEFNSK